VWRKLWAASCHEPAEPLGAGADRVLIVGSPNVGKSALFNRLTGRYVTVSNYPGTTVAISRGAARGLGDGVEVIDTPGMYSLLPITGEERAARSMLLEGRTRAVIHIVDAKNIERMLGLALQLAEAGLPLVLALNMADEADEAGVRIRRDVLEARLGVPVVATVATEGKGVWELLEAVRTVCPAASRVEVDYGPVIEHAIADIAALLDSDGPMSVRSRALLLLQGDADERRRLVESGGMERAERSAAVIARCAAHLEHAIHYHVAVAVKRRVDELLREVASFPPIERTGLRETLSRWCMNPWTGLPILAAVLYFGLYKFVGEFGAGTLVNFIESDLFEAHVNPAVEGLTEQLIPWQVVRDLLAGEYGIITLGVRYAIAIILPVVGLFFLVFAVLEDSGYLPRLAMLIDRVFRRLGLNGRAVIPLVLGFGCDTMATMVTRTLETKRERVIATFLLALAIPCSAQMGVILGILSTHTHALMLWGLVVAGVFLAAGLLAARIVPGTRPPFYMELPPLRLPRPGNVLVKTYSRMVWYFKEVLPLFILASVFIWVGQLTGLFDLAIRALEPAAGLLGLPRETAVVFLFGFFRRDYGAAGLYDIYGRGALSGNQLAVAAIVLTLFLPCVAQFLIMAKERGWRTTVLQAGVVLAVAFSVGWLVNAVLGALGVQL